MPCTPTKTFRARVLTIPHRRTLAEKGMYKLIIEDDEGKTTVVPLIRDEITIGRKEGNTIRLTERNVSRRARQLSKPNGSVFIEDLSSYNGIKINGDRIAGRGARSTRAIASRSATTSSRSSSTSTQPTAPSRAATTRPRRSSRTERSTAADPPRRRQRHPGARRPPRITAAVPRPRRDAGARFVVVSSNFAGKEFDLDTAADVIGRTDENDIVVNHRSISRNHAKVVREPRPAAITISRSAVANGVRVNGEDYGKVELRRGDIVDLGHVRLRFVEPGEDFVFARDAQIVDVEAVAWAARTRRCSSAPRSDWWPSSV